MPTKKDILDLYFIDARHKLIDIAAFLDRLERHAGDDDFRVEAFLKAIDTLKDQKTENRAQAVLNVFSDHSSAPLQKATTQSASGAAQV